MKNRRDKKRIILDRVPRNFCEGPFWGNGVMGAVLYIQGTNLCFTIDHVKLWELRETLPDTPRATFEEILQNKEKYIAGDPEYVAPTDIFQSAIGRTKLPGLAVGITLPAEVSEFYSETDMENACTHLQLRLKNDMILSGKVWLDSCDNVLCASFDGNSSKDLILHAIGWDLDSPKLQVLKRWEYKECEQIYDQTRFAMTQEFSGDQVAVLNAEHYYENNVLSFVVSIDIEDKEQEGFLRKQESEHLKRYCKEIPAHFIDHCKDWNTFWTGFDITLPDERLQMAFDIEMYKLYCNERANSMPVTLQGVWNNNTRMPAWYGDLHNDLNVQACYWAAFKTGNAGLVRPYIDYYSKAMKRLQVRAEKLFGIKDAIHIPTMMAPDGTGAASEWCYWNTILGPELFVTTDFCWFYKYTQDKEALQSKIYPFLVGVARLYRGIAVKKEDGYLHIPYTSSPEIAKNHEMLMLDDATFVISALHYLLNNIAEYADILQVDASEWIEFERELVQVQPTKNGLPLFPEVDLFESHRHFCQLYPIYPLCEEAHNELAQKSLDAAINQGFTEFAAFSFPYLSIMASRCSRGNMARTMLEIYCMVFRSRNSFTVNGDPYQNGVLRISDTNAGEDADAFTLESGFFIPAALCEMFVHRVKNNVWLMAGIPDEWKSCSCSGLAIEGDHRISIEQEDYRISKVELVAGSSETLWFHWRKEDFIAQIMSNGVLIDTEIQNSCIVSLNKGDILSMSYLRR
jgi:hypothetical protein